MKMSLAKAFTYFKYSSLLYAIVYTLYILYDDYVLYKKISDLSEVILFVGVQLMFMATYYVVFAFYFWVGALLIVFVYHKLLEPKKI